MQNYHPVFVALHWLLAFMIILALLMGGNVMAKLPNDVPEKLDHLRTHMSIGGVILILMLIRLAFRLLAKHPAPIQTGNRLSAKLGPLVHLLFYVAVIGMAASGIATSLLTGLPEIVFFGSGNPLPETFDNLLPRKVHGLFANLLWTLIGLHLLGFIYHQFMVKDNLLSRMTFRRKGKDIDPIV
ncbi:MAG: cytochrome b [Cohaesibacteraceae bacterium]|nr:cytochrome b [Cohaesibacteraceae bacterium]